MKKKIIIIAIILVVAGIAAYYLFFKGSSASSLTGGGLGSSSSNAAADAQYLSWIAFAKANNWADNNNDGHNKDALYQCRTASNLTTPQLQYLANKYNGGVIV